MSNAQSNLDWPARQIAYERAAPETKRVKRLGRVFDRIRISLLPSRITLPPGVYIFAYHMVLDPANADEWEKAYDKGWVSLDNFKAQIAFLDRNMFPLALTKAPVVLAEGTVDRPYFVITFDDGYQNVFSNAVPVLESYGIHPAIFVNGHFSEGAVYYRILASLLIKRGKCKALASQLRKNCNTVNWSEDGRVLFAQTKDHYKPGLVEEAVETAYRESLGEPETLGVHLGPETIVRLHTAGWEIGNHTYDHQVLSELTAGEIERTISKNKEYWERKGISLIKWLAYPNGAAKHVNQIVHEWFQRNPEMQGIFCNGGANFIPTKTQWLRMFAGNGDALLLKQRIESEAARTRAAISTMNDWR